MTDSNPAGQDPVADHSRRHRWAAAAVVAAVILCAAAIAVVTGPTMSDTSRQRRLRALPVAGRELAGLAPTIGEVPSDRTTGRFAYHRLRRWIVSEAGTPPHRADTPLVWACELHRWVDRSGAGRSTDISPPQATDLAAAAPAHRSLGAEFDLPPERAALFSPGSYDKHIPGYPPPEPAAMVRYLAAEALPVVPHSTLNAVLQLNIVEYLTRPDRAAVLRLLASTPGLTWHPSVVDRLGRRGVAVSADNGRRRHSLIFDPTTGQLLASESVKSGPADMQRVPVGLVTRYVLLVETSRRPEPA